MPNINQTRVNRVIKFIETLTIPEGMDEGKPFILRPWQKEIIRKIYGPTKDDGLRLVRKAIYSVGKKNGKGLAIDTPIPTPSGWTTMGDISEGDFLFDEKGNRCKVEFTSDVKNIDCYEVNFSNGEKIICDEQHLWETTCLVHEPETFVRLRRKIEKKQVRNIKDIFRTQKCRKGTTNNHSIDVQGPIKCRVKNLLISPYVLGVWLGDGDSDGARVSSGLEDASEMVNILRKEGVETKAVKEKGRNNIRIRLSSGRGGKRSEKIQSKLRTLDLIKNKHIPNEYLRASFKQRLSLLQGLMDTDGTCDRQGRAQEFATISKKLLSGFCELLSTLGIKYSVREKPLRCSGRIVPGTGYYVQFCCLRDILPVFRLKRKLKRQKKITDRIMKSRSRTIQITSVEKVSSVPTKCIRVDSPNSLFLCGKTMIPTHNTPLISAIIICHLIGPEAKKNEQMYSAAFEKEQAALTFNYMHKMINYDEELKELTIIRTTKKEIEGRYTGSNYKALSAEAKSKHGISPALLIFDELAQFGAAREYFDTLIQGFGAHAEPLLLIISTQAADDLAILSQEIDYALKHPDDETVELFLFTAPEQDENGEEIDLLDVENWKLANPALGDFLNMADMESLARMAVEMPSYEPGFRNLRLNQRISATSRFMGPGTWKRNGGKQNPDALFKGRITAGLDLSGKNDLSFLVLDALYEKTHNLYSYCWTPLDNIKERQKRDRVDYPLWVKQGYLTAVPGKTINYAYIAMEIADIHGIYGIAELRFDRWRIEDLQREFENIGCETYIKDKEEPPTDTALCLVPHGQGYKDMNPAIEAIEDAFTDSKARHGMHPVLTMCVSNAVIQHDPAKNRKFEKHKSTGRIDGAVSMAMAMHSAELPEVEEDTGPPPITFI